MSKLVEHTSFLGHKKIIVYEEDKGGGNYSYINGDWVWGE